MDITNKREWAAIAIQCGIESLLNLPPQAWSGLGEEQREPIRLIADDVIEVFGISEDVRIVSVDDLTRLKSLIKEYGDERANVVAAGEMAGYQDVQRHETLAQQAKAEINKIINDAIGTQP